MQYNLKPKSKKRIPWSNEEDQLLEQLFNTYSTEKQSWRLISDLLINKGYERNPKDCRERFQNYLDQKFNKSKLTKLEIDKLFELILIYGSKWTCIAEKLNNRTDQDVKNQFYAIVKKVFRRLLKASLSDDQKKKCSKITDSLRPILISNIFCINQISSQLYINISPKMKELFKSLILQNRSIKLGEILDETMKKKVLIISNYLGKMNDVYVQKKKQKCNLEQSNHIHIKSEKEFQYKSSFNQIQQEKIISKILNNQQIYTQNLLNIHIQFDIYQDKVFIEDNKQMEEEQIFAQQIISKPPFYQPYPNYKFYSNQSDHLDNSDFSSEEPFLDSNINL